MNGFLKDRHIGITESEKAMMLKSLNLNSMEEFVEKVIPKNISLNSLFELPDPLSEREYAEHIAEIASKNRVFTSYIGQGWYDTVTPAVVQRNVLENPSWYTSYTPYQAEISQGRLEALLNFQTAVCDFTGMPLANASLLDEATAAAEAVTMAFNLRNKEQVKASAKTVFVDENTFAHTIAVVKTRSRVQGIEVIVGDYKTFEFTPNIFAAIIQYPNSNGSIEDYSYFVKMANKNGSKVLVAADILSLALLTPPGEWGADVVFGTTQRWGTPMYFGGPSAGYFATKAEYKRDIPGRIIGISKDVYGKPALRLALQTREQHIKRERATSNICTAQALLAIMSSFYTVYHGAEGILEIANRVHSMTNYINEMLMAYGYSQENSNYFDTLKIKLPTEVSISKIEELALEYEVNFHYFKDGTIGISIDETTTVDDINVLAEIFATAAGNIATVADEEDIVIAKSFDETFDRKSPFLTNEVFGKYHSETELMRYIKKLERRDISLTHSMISLGSCTMKLNAASEVMPLSNPNFANIHPLAPKEQTEGYLEMISNIENYLSAITGFEGCSLQANSGAAGEFTGLLTIKSYHESRGDHHRDIILIPASAHGTNPASAVQCGYKPIVVKCDEGGNVDIADWNERAAEHAEKLAGCMITYPSTHGIFEAEVKDMCQTIHNHGGQVYLDGANMNGQVGLTHPGIIGADVCHLNLHKTFASPHGGGGPGVGPICVAKHLIPFLPDKNFGKNVVSSAPYGSAGIQCITYGYIRMLGSEGLRDSTATAILSANYLAQRLRDSYGVVYSDKNGFVGHELILECRNFKATSGITESDIAKRLIDYGYHAPTLSFPVHGTLMIEPTESESLAELDRFADVLIDIYNEIKEIENGTMDREDNPLKNSPHPQYEVVANEWKHSYTREKAAFPAKWLEDNKFWVNVARVDNAFGDRNLVCTCAPTEDYAK